ncbi:helix-turn-helix domain-containing protein [Priestia taiwanensis]|uniref:Transcriptional regulator n=1 Tax=Priestia taiwanensis TaxID=1347902 RepID=A0A917EN23_9BACI|nr:helix-turn-helix domain-containing protein [Priestia taiwanensis]MBM7362774.1 cytoskeletal protein RodZ [Priestia taiwanensis]GGE64991.1 transcriptional regulator [Priestia taiwanensis]
MTELGQVLKEAREAKGISLDELQESTKIQKRYLVSIEKGNFNVLPGDFYVRAFIKQYADAVGLDSKQLIENHFSTTPNTIPQTEDKEEKEEPVLTRKEKVSVKNSKVMDYIPRILVVSAIIGVLVAAWFIFQAKAPTVNNVEQPKPKTNATEVEKPAEPKEEPKEEKKEEEKEEEKEEPPAEPVLEQKLTYSPSKGKRTTAELTNNPNKAFVLELVATDKESYVSVGKPGSKKGQLLTTTLKAGDTKELILTEESEVEINIGSTPHVKFKINGQEMEYPLETTKNIHQIITIKNIGEKKESSSS